MYNDFIHKRNGERYFLLRKLIVLVILKILFFYQRPFFTDEHKGNFGSKKEPVCIVIKNGDIKRSIFTASIKDMQHEKNSNINDISFDKYLGFCTAKNY
jgi:hypothetical protein